ncbi:hypothetical protein ACJA88_013638 [Fusarium oxysporum]
MTDRIHTNPGYSSVGMIEVLNEPVSRHDKDTRYPAPGQDPGLMHQFYPAALKAVRDTEAMLYVSDDQKLHVQFMSSKWDSGNPLSTSAIANDALVAFDDHNYIGFALGDQKGDAYQLLHSACTDDRVVQGQDFTITATTTVKRSDKQQETIQRAPTKPPITAGEATSMKKSITSITMAPPATVFCKPCDSDNCDGDYNCPRETDPMQEGKMAIVSDGQRDWRCSFTPLYKENYLLLVAQLEKCFSLSLHPMRERQINQHQCFEPIKPPDTPAASLIPAVPESTEPYVPAPAPAPTQPADTVQTDGNNNGSSQYGSIDDVWDRAIRNFRDDIVYTAIAFFTASINAGSIESLTLHKARYVVVFHCFE